MNLITIGGTFMVMPLKHARDRYGFKPILSFDDADYGLSICNYKSLENSKLHLIVCKIIGTAHPTNEEEYDLFWKYFYLPLRRQGELITIPIRITKYKSIFFINFHLFGGFEVKKGNEHVEEILFEMFEETLRFIPVIKAHGKRFIEKTVPYDIRRGEILGKYIMDEVLPKNERENLLDSYQKHLDTLGEIKEISLNDYLNITSICYKAAFGKKVKGLKPMEMYKKWADGRDEGMLSIKNKNNKDAFSKWHRTRSRGGHPFEIVFSWKSHGIHLYPPRKDYPYYSIKVTNLSYASIFLRMVQALMYKGIPFQAPELDKVVKFLSGETFFKVNEFGDHFIFYIPSLEYRRKYFRHIKWEEIELPKWK